MRKYEKIKVEMKKRDICRYIENMIEEKGGIVNCEILYCMRDYIEACLYNDKARAIVYMDNLYNALRKNK